MFKDFLKVSLIWVLMLTGIGLVSYPFVSMELTRIKDSNTIKSFVGKSNDSDENNEIMKRVKSFNDSNVLSVTDPYIEQEKNDVNVNKYFESLKYKKTEVAGRLSVASLKIDLPIYLSTSESVLQRGVGHLYGTSLPIPTGDTHSVLSAHSGMTVSKMFDDLPDIKIGAIVKVETLGKVFEYKVVENNVILPNEASEYVSIETGKDYITLVTCTPYSVNTHRLLSKAEFVKSYNSDGNDDDIDNSIRESYMMLLIPGSTVLILFVGSYIYVLNNKRRK